MPFKSKQDILLNDIAIEIEIIFVFQLLQCLAVSRLFQDFIMHFIMHFIMDSIVYSRPGGKHQILNFEVIRESSKDDQVAKPTCKSDVAFPRYRVSKWS